MQRTMRRGVSNAPSLPAIKAESKAFRDGYKRASTGEKMGWNITHAPCESTIVEFMQAAIEMVSADIKSGSDVEHEVRWIAGLFAGWIRRENSR